MLILILCFVFSSGHHLEDKIQILTENKAFKLMSQNNKAVVMRKYNIIFKLRLVPLFLKSRLTSPLQTLSSLLFSLSFSLCFSLCFSELLSLCFSFSLSLCFFSQWSLCSLEYRSQTGQRSSARGQMSTKCTDKKKSLTEALKWKLHKH